MSSEKADIEVEANNLRRVAFFGVALSTVAVLVCVMSVPMLYGYIQRVQSLMNNEVDYCKSRTGNIWQEVTRTSALSKAKDDAAREKRQAGGGCCGCGVSPAGPPGPPGPDGDDGPDGDPEHRDLTAWLPQHQRLPRTATRPVHQPSQDLQAHPDHQDHLEILEPLVLPDLVEMVAALDLPDLPAHLDLMARLEMLEPLDPLETSPKCPALTDLLDLLDHLGLKDLLDLQDPVVVPVVRLDRPERREMPDLLDLTDSLDQTDLPEMREPEETAAAATTARPLARRPDTRHLALEDFRTFSILLSFTHLFSLGIKL